MHSKWQRPTRCKLTVFWKSCNLTCHTPYSNRGYSHYGDEHRVVQCIFVITRWIFSQILTIVEVWGILWVQTLIYILTQPLQWCMLYNAISDTMRPREPNQYCMVHMSSGDPALQGFKDICIVCYPLDSLVIIYLVHFHDHWHVDFDKHICT